MGTVVKQVSDPLTLSAVFALPQSAEHQSMGTVDQEHPVAVNINKLLETLPKLGDTPRHSIYRVPKNVRDNADKKHYEPQLVSIGPYHRGKEHLRAMEERKCRYLQRFLDECGSGSLEQCISSLQAREEKARACYFEDPKLDSTQFVEMLLLDGTFLLLFFLDSDKSDTDDDPNFAAAWSLPLLHTDLLMLENQIPYFVILAIHDIYRRHTPHPTDKPLPSVILQSFKKHGKQSCTDQLHELNVDHLLDLYYHHFITALPKHTKHQGHKISPAPDTVPCVKELNLPNSPPPKTVPCAKELNLHGVSFKLREKANIFDVFFNKEDGVLEIPKLKIEPLTCTVFLNLVAFEQSKRGAVTYFSSYVMLLDNLVNTVEDVHILNKSKILENMLPSEEEAAKFFNQLSVCSYIVDENHYLEDVHKGLEKFCANSWNKYKAMFRRNYHNSPWSIFGFYMGLLFALITVFTTIINILDKFTHVIKK